MTARQRWGKRLWKIAGQIFVAASFGMILYRLSDIYPKLLNYAAHIQPLPIILIIGCTLAVQMLMPLLWFAALRSTGTFLAIKETYLIFYRTNILKFLPGFLWNQPNRAIHAQQYGISIGVFSQGAFYELLFTFSPAVMLVGIGLSNILRSQAWLILSSLVMTFFLTLTFIPTKFIPKHKRIVALPIQQRVKWYLFGLAVSFLIWGLYATSIYTGLMLFSSEPLPNWTSFVTLNTTAWMAGFLSPAPAGLGVRELGLSNMLPPAIGDAAIAASLIQRIIEMLGEIVLWVSAVWLSKKKAHPTSPEQI